MKYILLVLFFFLTICHEGAAQYDIEDLLNKYHEYHEKLPQTRVHLEFNQPKYSPGDTAFFKVYFLSYEFQPIKGTQFITIQVLNEAGYRIHIQNVKVVEGKTSNQLIFSNELAPGTYRIEAYSDWMKNFDDKFYFRKPIVLAGRRKPLEENRVGKKALSLFPEGGHLVADVPNSVLISASTHGSGTIKTKDNIDVKRFEIGLEGVAKLSFQPKADEEYYLQMDGGESKSSLFKSTREECALQVISLGECSPLQVHVTTPPSSPLRQKELYLITSAYGKINYSKIFTLTESETTAILIPYRSLHEGLNQIFILDETGQLIAERVYFSSPMYSRVNINIEDFELLPRDSVEIEVTLSDFFGNPIKGEFSASVTNKKLFDAVRLSPLMSNELYLFNDLPELRPFFESANVSEEDWVKLINDILITQKWERSNWATVLSEDFETPLIPFKKSISFSGRMLLKETEEPIPDSTLISIYQDGGKIAYSTFSKKNGEFEFSLINDYWDVDKFYYKVDFGNTKAKKPDYFLLSDMVQTSLQPAEITFSDYPDRYGEYIHNKRIIDRSFDAYVTRIGNVKQEDVSDPNAGYLEAFSGEDVDISIGDFVLFPTMPDLIHEVVAGLQYRNTGGVSTIRVPIFSGGYTRIPPGDPVYIINGILTLDTESFLNLVPDEIVYIKLINDQNKLSKFGLFGRNGVVLVLTKDKDVNDESLRTQSFELAGINREIKFEPRNKVGPYAKSIPHLRTALYWIPSAMNGTRGKAKIKLKLSDDLGPMEVNVSGITFDGSPFSATTHFMVTRPGSDL